MKRTMHLTLEDIKKAISNYAVMNGNFYPSNINVVVSMSPDGKITNIVATAEE